MSNEKKKEKKNLKINFPEIESPINLSLKTDFYRVDPIYWDSSGMKFDHGTRRFYGTIPNTNIHTALYGTGFYVEDKFFDHPATETFIKKTLSIFPKTFKFSTEKELKYRKIIKKGECETTEFKASFKYDINEKKVSKSLTHLISIAVCAFLNSRGGILFIGVADNGNIYGLIYDLKYCFKNIDIFQQEIAKTIRKDLGGAGISYRMEIEKIDHQQICIIEVDPSEDPIFFQNHDYYVRKGSSNQKLTSKETYEYIKSKKKNKIN